MVTMVSRVKESHRPCTPVSQGVSKTSDQEQEQEQADRIAPSGGCDELNWTDNPGWIISGLIILIKASHLPSDCPSLLLRECVLLIGCGFECGVPQLPVSVELAELIHAPALTCQLVTIGGVPITVPRLLRVQSWNTAVFHQLPLHRESLCNPRFFLNDVQTSLQISRQ